MAQDFAKRSKSRPQKTPPRRFSLGSYLAGVLTGGALFLLGAYAPDVLRDSPANSAFAGTEAGAEAGTNPSRAPERASDPGPVPRRSTATPDMPDTNDAAAGTHAASARDLESRGRDAAAQVAGSMTDSSVLAAAEGADASDGTAEGSAERDLEFEFHNVLDDNTVEPDLTAYEQDVLAQQARQPTGSSDMHYLLQSGSFQIMSDAEMRRGSLLLLDLPATIVEARIDSKIWYRVIVGPYTARGDAQQAVSLMRANEIASIWLEQPQAEG